ncbi:MAG: hypothetical protein WDN06_13085 [Asticcacaulis sp.]
MKDWLEFVPFETGIIAVFLLRMAWKNANAWRPWLIAGGWSLVAVAIGIAWHLLGPVRGVFIALTAIMLAGLFTVALRFQVRPAQVVAGRDVALEPSDRKRVMWRGWLRGLLAGPMSGVAALGVGLMWAICTPGAPQTRMVIGGLLVPVLVGRRHGLDAVGRQDLARVPGLVRGGVDFARGGISEGEPSMNGNDTTSTRQPIWPRTHPPFVRAMLAGHSSLGWPSPP